jgi:hypothetical protein
VPQPRCKHLGVAVHGINPVEVALHQYTVNSSLSYGFFAGMLVALGFTLKSTTEPMVVRLVGLCTLLMEEALF